MELVYGKNYFHLAKIFILRLFKMVANQMSGHVRQLVAIAKSNRSWRQKAKHCHDWGMGAIYGPLEHLIVHKWTILLHESWLATGKWVKVFHYINQLQFSIVRKTALSYDLPAGRFTEVCVIVILHQCSKLEIFGG